MRALFVIGGLVVLVAMGAVWGCRPRSEQPQSTAAAIASAGTPGAVEASPNGAISAFANAISDADLRTAARLVKGGRPETDFSAITARLKEDKQWAQLSGTTYVGQGDKLTVATTVLSGRAGQAESRTDTFNLVLVRDPSGWLIVPPDRLTGSEPPFVRYAYAVAHPEVVRRSTEASQAAACLYNAKQLATALFAFSSDHGGLLKLDAETWVKSVSPYLKGAPQLHCPTEPVNAVSFSINTALIGRNLEGLRHPEDTVLLYEGKDGRLSFRHNGRATVAFADTGVKQIDAEKAKALRWEP